MQLQKKGGNNLMVFSLILERKIKPQVCDGKDATYVDVT